MIAAAAGLFVFLALSSAAAGVALPLFAGAGADKRVRGLSVANAQPERATGPSLRRPASSIPTLQRWLNGNSWAESTAVQLQRAGLQLRVGEYLLARLLLVCIAPAVPPILFGTGSITIVLVFVAACAAFVAPGLLVRSLCRRRAGRIEEQLIEFLPSLASSLRAGFALQHGIDAAARQLGPPLSDELIAFLNDLSLGATVESALQELSRRIASTDLDMVVTAILVQRTTGGSLAQVLDQATETLRERERIRGDVQTFTAQQRMTGLILSIYPVAVGLLLLAIMPATWSKLFTEPVGQVQLGIAVGLQVMGFLWIRRALRVEV